MAYLGFRVRDERSALTWSQQDLAEAVKKHGGTLTKQAIEKMELRDSKSSRESTQLALALGVERTWLETGKGPKRLVSSVDKKLKLLDQDDLDEVLPDIHAMIDRRLERKRSGGARGE